METMVDICPCCGKRWRILKYDNGTLKCSLCLSTWKIKVIKRKGKKSKKKVQIIENKYNRTWTTTLPRGS